ncbi:hypothetical protein ACFWPY_02505 [Streptomyces sp. NPDC058527]|uniref:hypothetical protein n=1 Tax=Streptomyces sp. NPDC058527 TaxID=3346539 RepID=UPI0036548F6B
MVRSSTLRSRGLRSRALARSLVVLLLVVCGALATPTAPAGAAPQPRVETSPGYAYEPSPRGAGEIEAARGAVLHRDRRRPATVPAGPAGAPAPAAPRPAGGPDGCRGSPPAGARPPEAPDVTALQVFRC